MPRRPTDWAWIALGELAASYGYALTWGRPELVDLLGQDLVFAAVPY